MINIKMNGFFAYVLLVAGLYGCSNHSEESKITIVTGQYYIREVISDKEDPFEVPEIDTIIILDQKNGYVQWTLKEWKNNSNFWMSTPEKYMVKWIKPCH